MSLARKSKVASAEVTSGYQAMIPDGAVAAPFIKLGSNTSGTISADANETTNQGMTSTKTIVFKVAMLLLFEFSPIHMPNHPKAARLATTVTVPATEITTVTRPLGAAPPGIEIVPLVPVVVTITMLVVDVAPGAAGTAGAAAKRRHVFC